MKDYPQSQIKGLLQVLHTNKGIFCKHSSCFLTDQHCKNVPRVHCCSSFCRRQFVREKKLLVVWWLLVCWCRAAAASWANTPGISSTCIWCHLGNLPIITWPVATRLCEEYVSKGWAINFPMGSHEKLRHWDNVCSHMKVDLRARMREEKTKK